MREADPSVDRYMLAKFSAARRIGVQLTPGLCFSIVLVLAASYISDRYGSPQILMALLLGMAFNSISKHKEFSAGIDFCAKNVLRFGVALLGARISFEQVHSLGIGPVAVVLPVVIATFVFGLLLAAMLKIDRTKALISAAAVAICGASAALAVAAVLLHTEKRGSQSTGCENSMDQHLLCTLVGVAGLSTIVMVVYPGVLVSMGLSVEQMGIFLGASIHDVAQVVGAGHMISDEVAELATYTKMLRVGMLVPVVMIIALMFRRTEPNDRSKCAKFLSVFPPFIIAFLAFMVFANMSVMPGSVVEAAGDMSRLCLIIAMAALGTKTNLVEMWNMGIKPLLLLVLNTIFIAGLALVLILY
ncbi:YeiH family protein [Marinimicrobium sp. ABcell2]|uniref:YeiH family protein n=1 Tax=Marinimicrobium sp. ABcell2 TaxID=3069751 RepID=UPI0027B55317|nr:putative sulfate exporter family transporter [Marinimicrobium sp. ABcell2]MDQ2078035.1 putative sulfate exporter family transporter [Marinimicrobium sp. ABcell2]